MSVNPDGTGGYRIDLERRDLLEAGSTGIDFDGLMRGFAEPEEIDPRSYHKTENQGSVGSCQGHDLSTCVEHCYHVAVGEVKQFSRAYAYYATQVIDGISGDQGSTIEGGVRLAKERGLPPEENWPYNGQYDPRPPGGWQAQYEAAAPWKIRSHTVLRSYADVYRYLASGVGAVTIGTAWGLNPQNGVCESFNPGGGGHATPFLGYSKRKDSQGRKYLWKLNSWGNGWGINGWAEIAPRAVDQMFGHQFTVMIGVSDLTTPGARKIDWAESSIWKS